LKPKIWDKDFAAVLIEPEALIYDSCSSIAETQTAERGGPWDKAGTRSRRIWRSSCVGISATQSSLVPRYSLKRRGHINPNCGSEKPWQVGNMCRKRHIGTGKEGRRSNQWKGKASNAAGPTGTAGPRGMAVLPGRGGRGDNSGLNASGAVGHRLTDTTIWWLEEDERCIPGWVRRRCRHHPLPSELGVRLAPHPAQAGRRKFQVSDGTPCDRCSCVTFTRVGLELFPWTSALLLVLATSHPAMSAPFRGGDCPIRRVMDFPCLSAAGLRFLAVLSHWSLSTT
jgi:hypothetical protein